MNGRLKMKGIARRAGLLAALALAVVSASAVDYRTVERASLRSDGAQANGASANPAVNDGGRYIAFESAATNLVAGDTNLLADIFLHDRDDASTLRVSRGLNGAQANGDSANPAISADGQFIAFESAASNLVEDDTNALTDIFVYDRVANTTARVSVNDDGVEGIDFSFSPSISADGTLVAFASKATNFVPPNGAGVPDIFVYNLTTATIERISPSEADGGSFAPFISPDGRYVAYESDATNIVPDDTNGARDIFVYDRVNLTTTRISVDSLGAESDGSSANAALSDDGRYIAYESDATNLVADDTNSLRDIFVYDQTTFTTTRVNLNADGAEALGGNSAAPAISADGRLVTFESAATNLVPGDTNGLRDIFVRDRVENTTIRASVNNAGQQIAGGPSSAPLISADGAVIAFVSGATNLVSGDSNGVTDIFVARQRLTPPTPDSLTAAAASETSITVSWGDVTGETGYRLEWSPDGVNDWAVLATPGENVTSYLHGGLKCATTRFYRLVAVNELGDSAYTGTVSATTTACVLPTKQLARNGDFENYNKSSLQPNRWTTKKLSNDRVRCDSPRQTFAHSGKCAYIFTGGPGTTSLTQDVPLANKAFALGDTLALSAQMYARKVGVNAAVVAQISYNNGELPQKITLTAPVAEGYVFQSGQVTLVGGAGEIKRIRLIVRSAGGSGRVSVDAVSLIWTQTGAASASALRGPGAFEAGRP